MYFHLIPALIPSGDVAQLRILARCEAQKGVESHIFTLRPVPESIRKSFAGIAQIHEILVHFEWETYWSLLHTAQKLRLKPWRIHVWGTWLLAPGLRLAKHFHAESFATLRHTEILTQKFRILRDFTRIVTNSGELRDQAILTGNRGNWCVIHDVLEPSAKPGVPQKSRKEFLKELNLPEETILAACVGPVSFWKRWEWAVWTIDSIVRVHPEMQLLFFDPEFCFPALRKQNSLAERERHRVMAFTRQYERENIIHFLPYREDFRSILPYMDYLWNPQTILGSSLAALEATAAGVPIVGTQSGMAKDVFPVGTFSALPPEPETMAMASATHLLWIQKDRKAEQIELAFKNSVRFQVPEQLGEFYK